MSVVLMSEKTASSMRSSAESRFLSYPPGRHDHNSFQIRLPCPATGPLSTSVTNARARDLMNTTGIDVQESNERLLKALFSATEV